jgi:hypothetical protein
MKNLYLALFMSITVLTGSAQVASFTNSISASEVINFRVAEDMGAVHLQFQNFNDAVALTHEVQRSSNGIDFFLLGTISPRTNLVNGNILYTDATPLRGVNYYRVRSYSFGGVESFSAVRKIDLGIDRIEVVLTPNPVVTRQLNVQLRNFEAGQYFIELINSAGVRVYSKTFSQTEGNESEVISLPDGIAAGLYTLHVKGKYRKMHKNVQVIR